MFTLELITVGTRLEFELLSATFCLYQDYNVTLKLLFDTFVGSQALLSYNNFILGLTLGQSIKTSLLLMIS